MCKFRDQQKDRPVAPVTEWSSANANGVLLPSSCLSVRFLDKKDMNFRVLSSSAHPDLVYVQAHPNIKSCHPFGLEAVNIYIVVVEKTPIKLSLQRKYHSLV
jgi:hypothetical protein